MVISKRKFLDYTLLFSTIALSGVPYFSNKKLLIPLFVILISSFLFRKKTIDGSIIVLVVSLSIITIIQTYIFNFYSIPTIIGVYLRVINGYLIVKILDKKFIIYYINAIYFLAIVSLIFYVPIIVLPTVKDGLLKLVPFFDILNVSDSIHKTIILYNIEINHLSNYRNSGPFWEPGAFAGYLTLALIFSSVNERSISNRKVLVIFITLLTTISTTAIFALFVLVFFVFYARTKSLVYRTLGLLFILIMGGYAYFQLDFLGAKIQSQILRASKGSNLYLEDNNTQRFLNILRDAHDFEGHELVGRGSHPHTRYSFQMAEGQMRTVGITDILVRMGTIFFLLMLFFLHKSLLAFIKYYNQKPLPLYFGSYLAILILLMSEVYFNFPLFWSLLFFQTIYINQEYELSEKHE